MKLGMFMDEHEFGYSLPHRLRYRDYLASAQVRRVDFACEIQAERLLALWDKFRASALSIISAKKKFKLGEVLVKKAFDHIFISFTTTKDYRIISFHHVAPNVSALASIYNTN